MEKASAGELASIAAFRGQAEEKIISSEGSNGSVFLLPALLSESLSLPEEELLSEDSESPWDGALICGLAGLGAGELDWSSVLFGFEEDDDEEDEEGVVGRPFDPI